MKRILTLTLFFLLTLLSCKKDVVHSSKISLISKIISKYSNVNYTDNFVYDSKNRIASVELQSNFRVLKYTYDNSDRVSQVEEDFPNGIVLAIYTYDYSQSGKILVVAKDRDGKIFKNFSLDYHDKQIDKGTFDSLTVNYNYDNKKNLIRVNMFFNRSGTVMSHETYTYDDKPSPFSFINGFNFHFFFFTFPDFVSAVNNITSVSGNGEQTTFEYNANGVPVKSTTTKPFDTPILREYTYIEK